MAEFEKLLRTWPFENVRWPKNYCKIGSFLRSVTKPQESNVTIRTFPPKNRKVTVASLWRTVQSLNDLWAKKCHAVLEEFEQASKIYELFLYQKFKIRNRLTITTFIGEILYNFIRADLVFSSWPFSVDYFELIRIEGWWESKSFKSTNSWLAKSFND